ncbi:MAG: enoyl-CoA hydratase/isomerase family protein [Actinomycetia bacterium]|nr:enoyl-CoA hydratase/isomerase family protein [Actinomycetes bacterium]
MRQGDQGALLVTQTTYEHLYIDTHGPITTITLNRPERLNALSIGMLAELEQAASRIGQTDTRVVVLTGQGPSFSAGMDLATFTDSVLFDTDADLRYDAAQLGGNAADAIEGMPQVTIAALRGNVVGGGVVLAASCDLRVAEAGTRFLIPEINLGIPLAWGGIERLVREVGAARTREFVMTGRPFSAEEAREAGFVNTIVPQGQLDRATHDLAITIAAKSRFAITTTKRHVAEILSGDTTRDDALGLLAGLEDRESVERRDEYLQQFRTRT